MTADSVLRVQGVTKSFGATPVLSGLDLDVPRGSCVAVLGPSGCGKSTLLRIVAGLEHADEGQVEIDGRLVDGGAQHSSRRVASEKRSVGLVFQELALWPHMDVRRNLNFVLEARRVPKGERAEQVRAAIEAAGLPSNLLERRPGELSGGERQRAAVARALVQRPALLLLDEPLTGLDRDRRYHLIATLRRLRADSGLSTLLVTHDQSEAFALADAVAVMRAGRVAQVGTPEDVYREPRSRGVAEFVGTASVLRARRESDGLHTPLGRFDPATVPDGPLLAVVRPEDVRFSASPESPRSAEMTGTLAQGQLLDAYFQGDHWMHTVDVAGSHVLVRSSERREVGTAVQLETARIVFVPQSASSVPQASASGRDGGMEA